MRFAQKIFVTSFLMICAANAATKTYQTPKLSSREEYRKCLEESDKLDPQLPILKERRKVHNQNLKVLQDEMNAHVATQSSLDLFKDTAIDEFNTKLEALNARGEEINKVGEQINKDLEEYNNNVSAANKRCAGIVVSYEDMRIVAKERAKKK